MPAGKLSEAAAGNTEASGGRTSCLVHTSSGRRGADRNGIRECLAVAVTQDLSAAADALIQEPNGRVCFPPRCHGGWLLTGMPRGRTRAPALRWPFPARPWELAPQRPPSFLLLVSPVQAQRQGLHGHCPVTGAPGHFRGRTSALIS